MNKDKILVAMSGGVDSSVAALLLAEQGHEVIGVSMHLTSCHRPTTKSCCSASDRLDARLVCDSIGIPHHTLDYREAFRQKVIQPFVAAYAMGRTPIPCVSCNVELKFSALFADMDRQGANCLATGHYARVSKDADRYRLFCGKDEKKDQSYYLFGLTQRELAHLNFPLGDLTKGEVRRIAERAGLATRDKPESQEICFVTDDDYAAFIEQYAPESLKGEGNFIDRAGNILGRHAGIHAYTIGQRRGLGIDFGKRMYVVEIRSETNEVVVGSRSELMQEEMSVQGLTWTMDDSPSLAGHDGRYFEMPVSVRIRSLHPPASARLIPVASGVRVRFDEPQTAICPGQAAVFYQGDEVIGGGWIQ